MPKYEVAIKTLDPKYVDLLVVALVRQGYNVYYNDEEKVVCFTSTEGEVTERLVAPEDGDVLLPCPSRDLVGDAQLGARLSVVPFGRQTGNAGDTR